MTQEGGFKKVDRRTSLGRGNGQAGAAGAAGSDEGAYSGSGSGSGGGSGAGAGGGAGAGADADADGDADGATEIDDKPTYVKLLEERTKRAEEQLARYIQAYKSEVEGELQKRLDRLQREAQRELDRLRGELAVELVEVLDNFDRSLGALAAGGDQASLRQGLTLVRDQFFGALEHMGVSAIPSLGARFDPHLHEAAAMARVSDPGEDGLVMAVLKEGYLMGERVIRPAVVQVGRLTQ